ncbi:MAG: extracellular solute-binding protein [Acholeplasmatales bacterium]|nr:extracellular solute-binding protein [Acholeplasmatales bacterium]
MRKKLFKTAFLGLAGLAVLGLASCGEEQQNQDLEDGTHKSIALDVSQTLKTSDFTNDGDKEIIFYHTMGDSLQKVLQTAIDKFEETYPGWKVKASQIGGYDDVRNSCTSGLSAGNQPDLAYCYADHVAVYMKTGKVANMAEYINATGTIDGKAIGYTQTEIADFVQGYYKEGFATNYANYTQYGYKAEDVLTMPYVKSTEVLYYNKTALDEVGLTVPTTWDELWNACQALVDYYPTCTPLGYDSEANWIINMCEQNGWGYTSAESPYYLFDESQELASWLDGLKAKYDAYYFTTQKDYGSYTSALFTKGPEAGGTVFSIGSSGGASHQASDNFKWGVAPLPGSKLADGTVNYSAISQGPSLVMFDTEAANASEKQLMTWQFVKMLEEPAYQASFSMVSGYNPARLSSFEIEEYEDFLANTKDIAAVTANVASQMTDRFFTSPAFNGSSTARDQMQSVLLYVIKGQKSGQKALADAASACGK